MLESKNASINLANQMFNSLINKGMYSQDNVYFIYGNLYDNKLYKISDIHKKANATCIIGNNLWHTVEGYCYFYEGLLNKTMGYNIEFPDAYDYYIVEKLIDQNEFKEMQCFPENDSIKQFGNLVIIKMAE